MNILVLLKQVPDTEAKINVSDSKINDAGIKWIISPYDEIAIEEAIRLKEKHQGTITVISVGPERVISSIRTAYAMGADEGIHVHAENYEMLDSFAITDSILKAIEGKSFDLILAGRQATDSDNGQVPIILATKLDYPLLTFVNKIELNGNTAQLTCEMGDGEAIFESNIPLVMTANDRLNEPRYPSLKGIMASKKKVIETKKLDELGISFGDKISVKGYNPPASRPAGKIIEAETPEEKAKELVNALHKEVKII